MVECLVSSRMAWDCGVADLAAGCCSGGRMPNAGARRALRSLAGASWSCRTDPLSRRPSSSIGNRLRKCVGKLAGAPKKAEHEDGDAERLARRRQRERERKRWCSWTCSSTTAADDGCTRRTTASSEFEARKTRRRERERESERAERYWALRFAELRPDARRQREKQKEAHRPKD